MILLMPSDGSSQEIPRPSQTRQRETAPPPVGSNIKVGQLHITAEAALGVEYVDNINLSSVDPISDFIFSPELGIAAAWRLTELNTLRFRSTFSLAKYLENSNYDRQNITLSPDSALSFKIYSGDFRIELYDQFSIRNETVNDASLSGISSLPRFENIAGISLLWDLNKVAWTITYDHYNLITLGSALSGDGTVETDVSRLDHSTEQISTSLVFRLNSSVKPGIEVVVSYSDYPDESVTDFSSLTVGPFAQFQLTRYTSIQTSAGIKSYTAYPDGQSSDSTLVEGDDTNSGYYANVAIVHQLNRFYADRLDFGHEDEADALSGRTKTRYVRYSGRWNAGRRITLTGQVFLEDIEQEAGSPIGASFSSNYRRFGGTLSLSYQVTDATSVSLSYNLTHQDADTSQSSFEQNRIFLRMAYRF